MLVANITECFEAALNSKSGDTKLIYAGQEIFAHLLVLRWYGLSSNISEIISYMFLSCLLYLLYMIIPAVARNSMMRLLLFLLLQTLLP